MILPDAVKGEILKAAVLAPSADNSQPWRYKWLQDSLALYRDANFSGSATDSSFVLTDLAIGCVIENIVLAAAQYGYAVAVNYFPEGELSLLSARLTFSPNQPISNTQLENKLAQQIEKRCTDRRLPFSGSLSASNIAVLQSAINCEHIKLYCYTQRKQIYALAAIIRQAEAVRFKSPSLHHELFSTVNFSEPSPKQGMTPAILGIELPARPFFRLISNWSAMKWLNYVGAAAMVAARSVTLPIRLSPALVAITTSQTNRVGIMTAGRQLERVWLAATAEGLAVHPYAAPGVLTLAKPELGSELDAELSQVQMALKQHFSEQNVVMFLRLGYKNGKPARSARRNVTELELT